MSLRDTPEWAKGVDGENKLHDCLLRDGYYVVRTADFTTAYEQAPRIHHEDAPLILPDVLAFKRGRGLWMDSKAKDHPNLFRITNTLEHGIDTRIVIQYLRVQEETGLPVWIVVYEICSGVFLCGRLDSLMRHCRQYDGGAYRPMTNFARDHFLQVSPEAVGGFDGVFF